MDFIKFLRVNFLKMIDCASTSQACDLHEI